MAVHPILIHFPIALLLLGHLALLFSLLRPAEYSITAGRLAWEGFINGTLGLGFAGLVLSVVTGLFDMQASPKALARDGWLPVAIFHIISALLLLPINGILLYRRFVIAPPLSEKYPGQAIPEPATNLTGAAVLPAELPTAAPQNKSLDRLAVALSAVALLLVLIAGFLGGMLVYEYRVGIK